MNNPRLKTQVSYPAIHNNRGLAWWQKHDLDRAIADFNEALRLDPKQSETLLNRALALKDKGEFEKAMADINAAIQIHPNDAGNYGTRGVIWLELGQLDKALADFNENIHRNPKEPAAYNGRALVWRDKANYDASISDFTEAIRLNSKFATAYASRGEVWRLKGDLDQAIADQSEAIRVAQQLGRSVSQTVVTEDTPADMLALCHILRGNTYRYRNEFDKALADYDQALKIVPDAIPAFTGRALTFEKMDNLAQARSEFQKALASKSQGRSDIQKSSLATARAHLAALASGAPLPVIPAAPTKITSETSIPTPAIAVPTAVPVAAKHQRRIALVIGNSAYQSVAQLPNPHHDANKIGATLRAIGFDTVTLAADASHQAINDALRTLANAAEGADWFITPATASR